MSVSDRKCMSSTETDKIIPDETLTWNTMHYLWLVQILTVIKRFAPFVFHGAL